MKFKLVIISLCVFFFSSSVVAQDCSYLLEEGALDNTEQDKEYISTGDFKQVQKHLFEVLNEHQACLNKEFTNLRNQIFFLESSNRKFTSSLSEKDAEVETLNSKILELTQQLFMISSNYESLINQITEYSSLTDKKIEELTSLQDSNLRTLQASDDKILSSLSDNDSHLEGKLTVASGNFVEKIVYVAFALILLTIFMIGIAITFRKLMAGQKTGLDKKIDEVRAESAQKSADTAEKLIGLIEANITVLKSQNHEDVEVDHSLALKVADEIVRIQKNVSRMDENTKGLKQLIASVKRIQDNFASNGYEIVDMLGQSYDDGMKVSANFIPSEKLEPNEQIITKIIKPQVNYKRVMIQSAQIEVSVGE